MRARAYTGLSMAAPHITIGWFTAGCVLVSNIIGGGIFTTTGILARDLGDPMLILLLWVAGALFAVGGAMIYAELGSRLPHAGGDYVYLREAYGPLWGFLYGWTFFLVIQCGTIAAVAVGFAKYTGVLIPGIAESHYLLGPVHITSNYAISLSTAQAFGIASVILLTFLNTRGLALGKWIQNVFTSAKTLALALLILLGLTVGYSAAVAGARVEKNMNRGAPIVVLLFVKGDDA